MDQNKKSLADNKKKIIVGIIILLAVLFIPHPSIHGTYKDGGTKAYNALTYKIVKWNRIVEADETDNKYVENGCYHKTSVYWFPDNFKSIDKLYETEYEKFEHKHDPAAPIPFSWQESSDINAKGYSELMAQCFDTGLSGELNAAILKYEASFAGRDDALYSVSVEISDGNSDQALVYVWRHANDTAVIECAAYFGHSSGAMIGPVVLTDADGFVFQKFAAHGIALALDMNNNLLFYDLVNGNYYTKNIKIESIVGFGTNIMAYYSPDDECSLLHIASFEKAALNPEKDSIEELCIIPVSRENIRIRHGAVFNATDQYCAILYVEDPYSKVRQLRVFDVINGIELSQPISAEHPEYSVKDYFWGKVGYVLCELTDNNGYYWFGPESFN